MKCITKLKLKIKSLFNNDKKEYLNEDSAQKTDNEIILEDFAVCIWRIEKHINKLLENFSDEKKKPISSSISKAYELLKKYGIEVEDYTNRKYNEGMNVEIIAVENREVSKDEIIKEVISPSIIINGEIKQKARVIKEI